MDKKFVTVAFLFAITGMCLGLFMAASRVHDQFVTHAHIMLIGFLLSFVYGLCHRLWLNNRADRLAMLQFYVHIVGAVVVSTGLFLLYGKFVPLETIDPLLALSSLAVLLSAAVMLFMLITTTQHAQTNH